MHEAQIPGSSPVSSVLVTLASGAFWLVLEWLSSWKQGFRTLWDNHSEHKGTTSFQLLSNITSLGLMLSHVSRNKDYQDFIHWIMAGGRGERKRAILQWLKYPYGLTFIAMCGPWENKPDIKDLLWKNGENQIQNTSTGDIWELSILLGVRLW